jgi:hypothetical protein
MLLDVENIRYTAQYPSYGEPGNQEKMFSNGKQERRRPLDSKSANDLNYRLMNFRHLRSTEYHFGLVFLAKLQGENT